jgi:hypothetical protein
LSFYSVISVPVDSYPHPPPWRACLIKSYLSGFRSGLHLWTRADGAVDQVHRARRYHSVPGWVTSVRYPEPDKEAFSGLTPPHSWTNDTPTEIGMVSLMKTLLHHLVSGSLAWRFTSQRALAPLPHVSFLFSPLFLFKSTTTNTAETSSALR